MEHGPRGRWSRTKHGLGAAAVGTAVLLAVTVGGSVGAMPAAAQRADLPGPEIRVRMLTCPSRYAGENHAADCVNGLEEVGFKATDLGAAGAVSGKTDDTGLVALTGFSGPPYPRTILLTTELLAP